MQQVTQEQRTSITRIIIAVALMVLLLLPLLLLLRPAAPQATGMTSALGSSSAIALAIPAFLAGVLSFLSPCTLPILPAYFAFTFGQTGGATGLRSRARVMLASLAFFAGLATTMVLVGASVTALGSALGQHRQELARIGGIVIIAFGVMSLLGKGFSGLQITRRSSATIAGAYAYGATFALGWTACIGPVLGAILTMLAAQGGSLFAGAFLSFVYVLGLAIPLMLVAVFFSRLGQGSRAWRILRGRGWEVRFAGRTFYLHSTSIISGLLLIGVGFLLASGQLSALNRYAYVGPAEWAQQIEYAIYRFFNLQ